MRESLYDTIEELDVTIYDSRSIKWSTFTFDNGYYKHRITEYEILRPYLISSQYYGNVNYEDIILLINNIQDPFEIVVGTEIKIPKIEDIRSFIALHRK